MRLQAMLLVSVQVRPCTSEGSPCCTLTLYHAHGTKLPQARPFSVYHTLLIRTIHELASSAYGGTVVAHCHDHMQVRTAAELRLDTAPVPPCKDEPGRPCA